MFENEHFLAVDKRSGFLSVPSRMGQEDSRPCEITDWMTRKNMRLWAIHRLDEEVSGVLLFAKNPDAHRIANHWFEKRQIEKLYQALSIPYQPNLRPSTKEIWKSKLLRGKKRAYEREFGKEAITEAQWIKNLEWNGSNHSLWNLIPKTGRSHQLRFEMSKHGFPIVGDELYGSTQKLSNPNAIALRAVKLNFSQCEGRESVGLPAELVVSELETWLKSERPL